MQSQRLLSETAKIEVMLYARFYRRLKSPPHRMRRRFGAATSVADLALESIKLAIEMESRSPSTISTGLKPSTSLGFGLYLSMAKFRPCSIQGSNGD